MLIYVYNRVFGKKLRRNKVMYSMDVTDKTSGQAWGNINLPRGIRLSAHKNAGACSQLITV